MLSECFKYIDKKSGFLQRFIIIHAKHNSEVISENSISLLYGIVDYLLTFDVLKQDELTTIPYRVV